MARVTDSPPPLSQLRSWPERMSFSQLSTLHPAYQLACPRRGAYRYITKLVEERSWPLALGTSVDAGWNMYWSSVIVGAQRVDAMVQGFKAFEAELADEVRKHAELGTEEDAGPYRKLGHSCLELLFERMASVEAASVQESHRFDLNLGDLTTPVIGYSDLVDKTGDVWDLKVSGRPRWTLEDDPDWDISDEDWEPGMKEVNPATGRMRKVPEPKPPKIEVWEKVYLNEKSDQLLTYWLARNDEEERRGEPIDPPLTGRVHLLVVYASLNLKTPQIHEKVIEVSLLDYRDLLVRYGQATRIVQAANFPLRPGRHCGWCSFVEKCRHDQAERGRPFMQSIDVPF